jgi:hypothetical protein
MYETKGERREQARNKARTAPRRNAPPSEAHAGKRLAKAMRPTVRRP